MRNTKLLLDKFSKRHEPHCGKRGLNTHPPLPHPLTPQAITDILILLDL